MSRIPANPRDWRYDERRGDHFARLPSKRIAEHFSRFPTYDILIHAPGGRRLMVCARYGYSPQPARMWRETVALRSANDGQRFMVNDIRGWIPWVVRHASCYPREKNRMLWSPDGVHRGYLCNSPDYAAIEATVALIRSIHGRVRVEWSLNFPCPDSLAPVNLRGAHVMVTDEFDQVSPR